MPSITAVSHLWHSLCYFTAAQTSRYQNKQVFLLNACPWNQGSLEVMWDSPKAYSPGRALWALWYPEDSTFVVAYRNAGYDVRWTIRERSCADRGNMYAIVVKERKKGTRRLCPGRNRRTGDLWIWKEVKMLHSKLNYNSAACAVRFTTMPLLAAASCVGLLSSLRYDWDRITNIDACY